ncbi:hypothetical protein BGZ73_008325, partial [Actinomortierella ambigua]
ALTIFIVSKLANPTPSVPTPAANQAAAAYAEQYQQYLKDYEKWAAAHPEYQHQPPAPPFDYSGYQQQAAQQPQPQQQAQQQLSPEQQQQYAQQWAAYYAQYGYTAPSAAPTATPTPPTSTASTAHAQAAAYSAYYAQYPPAAAPASSAAPPTQAYSYPGAGSYPYPAASQPAQAPSAYPYPYHYPGQHPQHPPQHQPQYRAPPPTHTYPSNYSQRPPAQTPGVTSQAPTTAQQSTKRKTEDVRQQLQHTSIEDRDNMTKTTYEKPAYLAVKAKKVKPHSNNVLNANNNATSTPAAAPSVSTATSASQPSEAPNRADGWPQSLKNYVKRVFEAIDDKHRDEAHRELKTLVSKHHLEGTLWTADWDNMKVPEKFTKGKRGSSRSPERPGRPMTEEERRREKRRKRFEAQLNAKPSPRSSSSTEYPTPPPFSGDAIDWDRFTIVGTCQDLEKPYLRLTSAPEPATVRPLEVLKKTLEFLKKKWLDEGVYPYICDQFKSLRQDLMVQRIKNEFTVSVYETHARIALEKSDLGEYHQCQTQLKELYAENIPGSVMEFTAYRILYLIHTRNPSDIISMLASLTKEQKEDESVRHALAVRRALSTSNYYQLFKLYHTAPKMGAFLMDQFVERERVEAMRTIVRSLRTPLPISRITTLLAFKNEDECYKFLVDHGVGDLITPKSNMDSSLVLEVKRAIPILDAAASKYHVTDLKGQL